MEVVGNELEQLRDLNELGGCLRIDNLENVKSKESATAANLKEKKYLDELKLVWHDGEDNVNSNLDVEILEGLQLPPNLTSLHLDGYRGQLWPSWPESQTSNIEKLELWRCKMLEELPPMDQLYPSCRSLELHFLSKLKALHTLPLGLQKFSIIGESFLTFATNEDLQMSPADKRSIIEVIRKSTPQWFLHKNRDYFVFCEKGKRDFLAAMNDSNNEASSAEHNMSVPPDDMDNIVAWERWLEMYYERKTELIYNRQNEASSAEHNMSVPADNRDIWDRWLEMYERKMELIYNRQNEAKLLLPSTLTKLRLDWCNITDDALSACLQTLTSLNDLTLRFIETITCLPSEVVLSKLKALQDLHIGHCWALISLGGIGSLPCLTNLFLDECPCLDSETAFLPSSLENIKFRSCAVDVILANAELPCLSDLDFIRCHMQTASLQLGKLPSLRSLNIYDMEDYPPRTFSVDLRGLDSLEKLFLRNCTNLRKLENFPRSLKRLEISECPILERSIITDPCWRVSMYGDIPVNGIFERAPHP